MTKGYNLPDNVGASDPEAPWNQDQDQDDHLDDLDDPDPDLDTCIICGSEDVVAWVGDESFCQDCLEDEVDGWPDPELDLLQVRDLDGPDSAADR